MARRIRAGDVVWEVFNRTALLLMAVACAYPFIWVASCSLSHPEEVIKGAVWFLPKRLDLTAYQLVLAYKQLWIAYGNTLYYTVVGTTINVTLTMLFAFPLSRTQLLGRGAISWLVVFTMLFSGGLIPSFLVVSKVGLVNTRGAMVIPGAISAWNLIMARTYLSATIPDELLDAAYIDGANDLRVLWSVVLPLSGPILAVITLFYAVGHWNSFFNALIYLRDIDLFPLQVILQRLASAGSLGLGLEGMGGALGQKGMASQLIKMKYAVIMVATVPILLVYPFLQRYFTKGVMIGALKG